VKNTRLETQILHAMTTFLKGTNTARSGSLKPTHFAIHSRYCNSVGMAMPWLRQLAVSFSVMSVQTLGVSSVPI